MNLATRLVEAAHAHGDRPAVRLDDTVLAYAELLSRASDVAAELVGQGFQPGDRAGLLLPNAPAYPVHFYGILLAGGIVVPMNPLLRAPEIEYHLRDCGASHVFASPEAADEARSAATETGTTVTQVDLVAATAPPSPAVTPVERAAGDTALIL